MNNGIEGDVQSRMDAFRGNPQALAQRYAQNQQLIDLLALQKLKSEKEAAARQMQMQSGQGQMPTIAQQREQELMGMAKQDVAQRVGAVGQQQAQQQQKNLQQAMQGGIAQAPAPNMMPPQAMASGGIVAFAEGGGTAADNTDEPRLPGESDEAYLERVGGSPFTRGIKRLGKSAMDVLTAPSPIQNEEYARLRDLERNVLPQYSRGMFSRMTPEQERAEQAVQNFYRQNKEQIVREPGLYEAFKRDPVGVAYGRTSTQREAVGKVAAPTDTSYAAAEEARARARQQMVGQAQAAPAQVPPGSPPGQQPAGAIPAPGGAGLGSIAPPGAGAGAMPSGAPQGQGAQPPAPQAAPAQPNELQGILTKGLGEDIQASPEARAAAERAAYDKQFGPLYQQQQELSQQGIAQLQQRMAQQPKKDPLTEFLRGMSSQRTLGMALGAGGAGMNAAQREEFKQQAELEDQLQKLRETGLGAQVTQETARYGAGKEAAKTAAEARKAAMQVAGPYLSQSGVADVRAQLNDAALQLRQQGLNQQLIAAATTAANHTIDNLQQRLKVVRENKAKVATATNATELADAKAEESRILMELQNVLPSMLRLFGVPVDTKNFASPAPTAGPAIPPPPKDAVRLKGAK